MMPRVALDSRIVANDSGPVTEVRTFLIADVRGYSGFTDREGNEAAARLAD